MKSKPQPWDKGKVIVSENKRFLQHENGQPFFWLADTGWLIFDRLNRMEVEIYLRNRKKLGYNVIQAMVIHEISQTNVYGSKALMDKDFYKINEPETSDEDQYNYWKNVDFVIEKAAEVGLYMALVPVWGSVVKNGYLTENKAEYYGRWLAERYKDYPNIFWLNGGDIKGNIKKSVWTTLGKTIKSIDPDHLMTFHPFGRRQSSTWFHEEEWLDFNMFQSGHRRYDQRGDDPEAIWKGEDNWRYVEEDYQKKPIKPTLDGEPSYEGIPQGLHDPEEPFWKAQDCRRYAYWSVLAGACGHTYGHGAIMQMNKPEFKEEGYGVKKYWYEVLEDPGGNQMRFLKNLILSRPYYNRVPDQSLVAGDSGEKYDKVIVSRGQSYIIAYIYTARSFKLKMGKITGDKVKTWWYHPETGTPIFIGEYKNHRF